MERSGFNKREVGEIVTVVAPVTGQEPTGVKLCVCADEKIREHPGFLGCPRKVSALHIAGGAGRFVR